MNDEFIDRLEPAKATELAIELAKTATTSGPADRENLSLMRADFDGLLEDATKVDDLVDTLHQALDAERQCHDATLRYLNALARAVITGDKT